MAPPIPSTSTITPPTAVRRVFTEIKEFAREEPVAAIAAVCALGLLVKLLPRAWVVGTATTVGAALVKPALLSLGLTKAMELYLQRPHTRSGHSPEAS